MKAVPSFILLEFNTGESIGISVYYIQPKYFIFCMCLSTRKANIMFYPIKICIFDVIFNWGRNGVCLLRNMCAGYGLCLHQAQRFKVFLRHLLYSVFGDMSYILIYSQHAIKMLNCLFKIERDAYHTILNNNNNNVLKLGAFTQKRRKYVEQKLFEKYFKLSCCGNETLDYIRWLCCMRCDTTIIWWEEAIWERYCLPS